MPTPPLPTKPPTIANLQSMGLDGLFATCPECLRSGAIPFDALRLPLETPFPAIAAQRQFVCTGCGSKKAALTPDWRRHKAQGGGLSGKHS